MTLQRRRTALTDPSVADWMAGLGYRFGCSQCGRTYKNKSHLRRHVRYECNKEPEFACPYCQRKFHQKSNMRCHVGLIHRKKMEEERRLSLGLI